ncbi:hypothetical protein GGI07_002480 [Coemansia sp. Benny D115]|nr:hypothetical protein GGI07_002480 [Coemansia sp. Benny D115]
MQSQNGNQETQKLDAGLSQLQQMLMKLTSEAEILEESIAESKRSAAAESSARVAEAYKDMVKTEQAIDSFESRLDMLLGRLDGMIEEQKTEQQQQQGQQAPDGAVVDSGNSKEAAPALAHGK